MHVTLYLLLQQFIVLLLYLLISAMPWVSACSAGTCTPRRGHRESRDVPVWGHKGNEGQGCIVEHGGAKAEALGLQSGSWTGRNLTAERHERAWGPGGGKPSLETQCKHQFSRKMGLCMKHLSGRRSEMKEKESATATGESGDTATSNTLQC